MIDKHEIRIIGKDEKVFGRIISLAPNKDSMPRKDRYNRYPVLCEALEKAGK